MDSRSAGFFRGNRDIVFPSAFNLVIFNPHLRFFAECFGDACNALGNLCVIQTDFFFGIPALPVRVAGDFIDGRKLGDLFPVVKSGGKPGREHADAVPFSAGVHVGCHFGKEIDKGIFPEFFHLFG